MATLPSLGHAIPRPQLGRGLDRRTITVELPALALALEGQIYPSKRQTAPLHGASLPLIILHGHAARFEAAVQVAGPDAGDPQLGRRGVRKRDGGRRVGRADASGQGYGQKDQTPQGQPGGSCGPAKAYYGR
jgi:hypothetical protein